MDEAQCGKYADLGSSNFRFTPETVQRAEDIMRNYQLSAITFIKNPDFASVYEFAIREIFNKFGWRYGSDDRSPIEPPAPITRMLDCMEEHVTTHKMFRNYLEVEGRYAPIVWKDPASITALCCVTQVAEKATLEAARETANFLDRLCDKFKERCKGKRIKARHLDKNIPFRAQEVAYEIIGSQLFYADTRGKSPEEVAETRIMPFLIGKLHMI